MSHKLHYFRERKAKEAMKSFRLTVGPREELTGGAVALLIGTGLFLLLRRFRIEETAWRIVAAFAGAVAVGHLCRGHLYRSLRQRYPKARWIALLAVGVVSVTFGAIALTVVRGASERPFALAFILLAGGCILAFIIINRRDRDVTR